jgi:GntR family transcriptional regulator
MVHLDYRDVRPIYAQIADGFRSQITSRVLQPGEKLPSVRELAVQLSINPNTIQRSYRQLEAEGWIATVPGKGCFVCGLPEYSAEQRQELLAAFDKSVAALLQIGATREELIDRIKKEGNEYA